MSKLSFLELSEKLNEELNCSIAIGAFGLNGEAGIKNGLCWHIPDDLTHFKKHTTFFDCTCGLVTWSGLPNAAKKNRNWYVLTNQSFLVDNCKSIDLDYALKKIDKANEEESKFIVCGGPTVYRLLEKRVKYFLITKVLNSFQADASYNIPSYYKLIEESETSIYNNLEYKLQVWKNNLFK